MLWLDIALAKPQDAEQAFFEFDDDAIEDDIPACSSSASPISSLPIWAC